MLNKFIKGHEYRDTGSWRYNLSDQFNLAFASGNKSIENCGGIRRRYFICDNHDFRIKINQHKIPSVLVLMTRNDSVPGPDNPWNDEINGENLTYHGDNKSSNSYHLMQGCKNLINVHKLKNSDQNYLIPPILHFSKHKTGYVTFNGMFEIKEIGVYNFSHNGFQVENLECQLKLIDDSVNMKWIRERTLSKSINELKRIDKKYNCYKQVA